MDAWGLVTSWTEATRGRKTGIQSTQWIFLRRAKGITGFGGVSTCIRDRSPDFCASPQDFLHFALSSYREVLQTLSLCASLRACTFALLFSSTPTELLWLSKSINSRQHPTAGLGRVENSLGLKSPVSCASGP